MTVALNEKRTAKCMQKEFEISVWKNEFKKWQTSKEKGKRKHITSIGLCFSVKDCVCVRERFFLVQFILKANNTLQNTWLKLAFIRIMLNVYQTSMVLLTLAPWLFLLVQFGVLPFRSLSFNVYCTHALYCVKERSFYARVKWQKEKKTNEIEAHIAR